MKPMNPKSISPSTAAAADANNKKLVQSRLPFKLLTGTPVKGEASTPDSRKRKLSAGAEETRPAKRKVSEVKENLDAVIVLDDDDTSIVEGKDDSVVVDSETLVATPISGAKTKKAKGVKQSAEKEVLLIKFPAPKKKKVSKQLIVEGEEKIEETPEKSVNKKKKKKTKTSPEDETKKSDSDEVFEVKSEEEEVSLKETVEESSTEKEETVSELKPMDTESDEEVICLEEEEIQDKIDEAFLTPKRVSKRIADSPVVSSKKLKSKTESESSSSPASASKKLTPGQLKKKVEAEKRKEERLQLLQKAKEEREKKLQEEKEQKQQKELLRKKERDEKEEQKKKERDEKEEARKKEKEEKEQKRLAELEQKSEEKRKKDEQKEEERRKKELEKEEEENKKKRASQAFTKFFSKQAKPEPKKVEDSSTDSADVVVIHQNFMPFRIKGDMKLAPPVRRVLEKENKTNLEEIVFNGKITDKRGLYLSILKKGLVAPRKGTKTWEVDEDDILLIEELGETSHSIEVNKPKEKHRAKFLKFQDNRRPAYYGTWRKASKTITARRPFATDSIFDYENDSDDEWEEEEPGGESLHGSDDEKDKESDDDYEVDNEFFVPHGYLSDEENNEEDEIEEDNRPETQKAKLKILQQEFADEMKKKTEKIKPRLIGCIWLNKDGSQPSSCPNVIWDMLQVRSMIFDVEVIKKITAPKPVEVAPPQDKAVSSQRVNITEDEVPDLIRLIHGNLNNKNFLVKEFREYQAKKHDGEKNFRVFSNVSVMKKIKELGDYKACPEDGPMLNKLCWYISPEKLIEYELKDLSLPNSWNYILPPKENKRIETKEVPTITESVPVPPASTNNTKAAITKFTKVLSKDDIKKQFNSPSTSKTQKSSSPAPSTSVPTAATTPKSGSQNKTKKRVPLLMSVPRGQAISEKAKNSLIDKFLKTVSSKDIKDEIEKQMLAEEVIILD